MGSETTQMSNEDEKQAKHKCNGNELNGKCMGSETIQMSAMKTKSKEAWNQISAMKTKFIEWESNEFNEDEIYWMEKQGKAKPTKWAQWRKWRETEGEVSLNRKSKVNTKAIKTDKTEDESYSLN